MTLHLHILKGCSPAPLANYLKALGILRLVGEQADAQARGWWDGERFCLLSTLSKEELETFFLVKYEPTPLLSPWNAGSGFYRTWDAKKKKLRNSKNAAALDELLAQGGTRVQLLRSAVEEVNQVLPRYCQRVDVTSITDKERGKLLILPEGEGPVFPVIPKDDSGKTQVQQVLLRFSRSSAFYHSALVEVEEEIKCLWLWGSGGNDGGIDYTGRFFENLQLVLMPKDHQANITLLQNALFAEHAKGFLSKAAGKVGQFSPSAAGGANVTTGTGSQHETHLNAWDYVLMLEGAILFASRATKRLDPNAMSKASAPFAVRPQAVGFASSGVPSKKAKKQELEDLRGEQWMPLWKQPATLSDLSAMLGEARVQLGRQPANCPVDMVRAISRLGVARGVDSFVRYGYLKRNGKSMLSVPLGRIRVNAHPNAYLIEDLAQWMSRIQRICRKVDLPDTQRPARLVHAERRLADAVFAALTHDPTPDRWQAILLAAAEIEALQATGTGIDAGVLHGLKPEWVEAVDDGTPEFRLALALGSAAASYFQHKPSDPIRHHVLPLEPGARRFKTADKKLVNDPRVVVSGRDAIRDLAAIVERRLIEATQKGQRRSRLVAAAGCGARFDDLARFLCGAVDLERLFGLARAFMAIKWDQWSREHLPRTPASTETPEECWMALRLCCLPFAVDEMHDIPADERVVRLLASGDAVRAIEIARQRLRSVGIRPPMYAGTTEPEAARRWAAALAFPIHRSTALRVAAILDPSKKGLLHA